VTVENVSDEAIELQLSSLIGKGEREFVSLEHEIPEGTGQFIRFQPTGRGGRSLRAKAASNDVLKHPYRLSPDQLRVIMSLGWAPPKKNSPNFSKEFKPSAPADFQEIVALVRKTFRDGYQLPENAPITLTTSSDAPAASTAPVAEGDLRPDIAAARKQMRATIGSGKEVKRLAPHLWEGERVERMAQGQGKNDATAGLLVLTDRRLLYLKQGMFGSKTEDFPLDKISSVEWSSGMATGTLTVFAMGNQNKIKNMNKDDGKEITDLLRNRISASMSEVPVVSPAPEAGPVPDIPDQLRKLAELRDEGILTPEEFEAKKADLLARM
jgi:T3SS (YopN, CesT) and YbjN peptide-binding chaperone 3/Bacterial PH domain/Short C-terminal domain